MTFLAPPKLLRGFLVFKGYVDYVTDKNSPVNGKALSWNYDIKIYPSTTSYPGQRQDYQYNGLDVKVGDWISSSVGGYAVKIISINGTPTSDLINVTVEDVDSYNAIGDSTGNGNGAPFPGACFIFEVTDSNRPVLTPEFAGTFAATYGVDLISRFEYTNENTPDTSSVELKNITLNWTTKFNVSPNDVITFTLPTGPDFFVSGATVSNPMILECHQTSQYTDTNPYKFIAITNQLVDDGTYVTSGSKYYGPRYIFLQNTDDRTSSNSYWKMTYTGDTATVINIVLNISSFSSVSDKIIIYDNSSS